MKRMWDFNELIKLIREYGEGVNPDTLDVDTISQLIGINSDNEIVKGNLFGQYVRIMDAPTGNFTTEQYNAIKEGVFINGDYLGFHNPIIFPYGIVQADNHAYVAIIGCEAHSVGGWGSTLRIDLARINSTRIWNQKKIFAGDRNELNLFLLKRVNDKVIPSYPSDSDNKVFACENGTLKWVQNPLTNIAPVYDSTATYAIGDLVLYNGILYQCSAAVETAEAWDESKWTQTTLAAVIGAL